MTGDRPEIQSEIHIDIRRLEMLLFGIDESAWQRLLTPAKGNMAEYDACTRAIKAVCGLFDAPARNSVEMQIKVIGMLAANSGKVEQLLLNDKLLLKDKVDGKTSLQRLMLGVINKAIKERGADALVLVPMDIMPELLFSNDQRTCAAALKIAKCALNAEGEGAAEVKEKIIGVVSEDAGEFKDLIVYGDIFVQADALELAIRMLKVKGADAPDVSLEAIEVMLGSSQIYSKELAKSYLEGYLETGPGRGGMMHALHAEAGLSLNPGNCTYFRSIATSALKHVDTYAYGLGILGAIISSGGARPVDKKEALKTAYILLNSGMDISTIENDIRAFARNREPLSETARMLLRDAEMKAFNKPGVVATLSGIRASARAAVSSSVPKGAARSSVPARPRRTSISA